VLICWPVIGQKGNEMHIISLDDGQVIDLDTRAGAYVYVGTWCVNRGADPIVLSALELLLDTTAPLGELPPAKANNGG
jgi:hypothetical protein